MIDIQLDWATSATILGTVVTFAGFMYGIFKGKKKDDSPDSICEKEKAKIEQRLEKLETRANAAEKSQSYQDISYKSLKQDVDDLKEERKNENREYLDKLSRIEDRIGKMLDLIININSKSN